jgi:hypothetical protein
MNTFAIRVAIWAAALTLGFVAVFTLGRPIANDRDELDAAMHPAPPVSQLAAEQSAATIVRLQYGDLVDAPVTVLRRSDFGIDRWVVTYSAASRVSGVTISITVATGKVDVAAFP